MKIPFSPPYIDDTVINEVVDSLRSGWITSGPKVKALEEEIKSFSGAKEVLCVNSWTSRSEERRVGKECRSRWSPYH